MVEVVALAIPDVKLIRTPRYPDGRGVFAETYNAAAFREAGVDTVFVQDNHVASIERGTIRGLHFQHPPHHQAKLVRVLRGAILDVSLDLRPESPSRGRYVTTTLTAQGGEQVFIPAGFAHGYCTLEPSTEVLYKVDSYYAPGHAAGIAAFDAELAIPWPVAPADAVLSDRDTGWPGLAEWEGWRGGAAAGEG
jgi:dTDP-4-dehydrorhamnose 3,5-epimerase